MVMKWNMAAFASVALLILGCEPGSRNGSSQGAAEDGVGVQRGYGAADGQRQRQAALLNRLRQSDPQFQVIERAIFNERNELGIILDRTVEMTAIRPLMRSIMTEMAREFPGQDLTVIAYAPAEPPIPIGTGRLNGRTREMSYTPAQHN